MFCANCGTQMEDDAAFCPNCGTKTNVTDTNNNVKNITYKTKENAGFIKKNIHKIIGLSIMAVGLVIVFFVAGTVLNMAVRNNETELQFTQFKGGWAHMILPDSFAYRNGNIVLFEENINEWSFDLEGDNVAYIDNNGTLYAVGEDASIKTIDKNVSGFLISPFGEVLLYSIIDIDAEQPGATTYIYDIKKDEIIEELEIDFNLEDVPYYFLSGSSSITFPSPDGEYIIFENVKDNETVTFYGKIGGEYKSIKGASPLGISNNGQLVFYLDDESEEFCILNTKKNKTITLDYEDIEDRIECNNSLTELLIYMNGDTYYYDVDLKEPVMIAENDCVNSLLTPYGVLEKMDCGAFYININNTFKNSVLRGDNSKYYLLNSKATELTKITKAEEMILSDNGRSVVYYNGKNIIKIDDLASGEERKLLKEEGIRFLECSSDLEHIYYMIDGDHTIYYVDQSDPDDIETVDIEYIDRYDCEYSEELGAIVFLNYDELCYVRNSDDSVEEIADNVSYFMIGDDGLLYYAIDDEELYVYTSGKSELVFKY